MRGSKTCRKNLFIQWILMSLKLCQWCTRFDNSITGLVLNISFIENIIEIPFSPFQYTPLPYQYIAAYHFSIVPSSAAGH